MQVFQNSSQSISADFAG